MADYVDDPATAIVDPLADTAFHGDEAKKIAWYAGVPTYAKVFYFVKRHIRWLRDLPWTVLYVILGLVFIIVGSKIIREPDSFRI